MRPHHSLDLLFDAAQRERRCAHPFTDTDVGAVARRLKDGSVTRTYRGLYARSDYWQGLDPHERIRHIVRSLAVIHPTWVFCGPTAAVMYGLDCPYRLGMPIRIVAAKPSHGRGGRQLERYTIAYPEQDTVDGVRVTGLARTLFDCVEHLPLRYALPPLDSALRSGRISRQTLLAYPNTLSYVRDREYVNTVFALADGRSENGGESEARGVFSAIGCPVSDIQVEFPCLERRGAVHRVDYLWRRDDGTVLIGEFDGTRKYVDPSMTSGRTIRDVVDKERDRQRCLERHGSDMVRFYYPDLDRPHAIMRKLSAHGLVPGPGIVRRHS